MFTRPSFGLAEIAWRWSFGFAAVSLLMFCFLEFLKTLPVSGRDLLLLRSRHPVLISQALAHIFRGSAPRLVAALLVLVVLLALGWMIVASIGRAITIKGIAGFFREQGATEPDSTSLVRGSAVPRWRSLFGLNLLRTATALAAVVGCVGAFVLAGLVSSDKDPAPGSAFLIFLTVLMLVGFGWSVVNWFLSLAAVFAIPERGDTFGAIRGAVDLCRYRAGSVAAAGTWFGIAHTAAFFVASSIVAFPLAFAGLLPGGVVFGGVVMITLLYFAIADYLYVGRLAAYIAILEIPPAPAPAVASLPPRVPLPETLSAPLVSVDKDEAILSDLSAPLSSIRTSIDKNELILSDGPSVADEPDTQ
jgi:hypothetical protein